MWIQRDIHQFLQQPLLPVQILLGPRQCGKSSLFHRLNTSSFREISLDDLRMRQTAENDLAFFLEQNPWPLFIDEAPYSPRLFPQIKLVVDQVRRKGSPPEIMYRLTGSNQILMDRRVKESLAGRASYFRLHPLSVSEINSEFPTSRIEDLIFKGGWPELWRRQDLAATDYLNDYLQSYLERDIALGSGVTKLNEFTTAVGLLAARTGQVLSYSDISKDAGVAVPTIKEWVTLLERSHLCGLLRPFYSNLNKRLIKSPKFYFIDTGLAARLQGHLTAETLMQSPQAGALFETLVLSEIVKARDHHRKTWALFYWRTKEGEEYDFIIRTQNKVIVLDAKMAIHGVLPLKVSPSLSKSLKDVEMILGVVTYGGTLEKISPGCWQIPVKDLTNFLVQHT